MTDYEELSDTELADLIHEEAFEIAAFYCELTIFDEDFFDVEKKEIILEHMSNVFRKLIDEWKKRPNAFLK